ncbi:hypothetical protein C7W93_22190 [Glaciimonas sp. PCH181]|nr:hypothetical protein C7W93_22190 [Glaciimonas sp. PCH181]
MTNLVIRLFGPLIGAPMYLRPDLLQPQLDLALPNLFANRCLFRRFPIGLLGLSGMRARWTLPACGVRTIGGIGVIL